MFDYVYGIMQPKKGKMITSIKCIDQIACKHHLISFHHQKQHLHSVTTFWFPFLKSDVWLCYSKHRIVYIPICARCALSCIEFSFAGPSQGPSTARVMSLVNKNHFSRVAHACPECITGFVKLYFWSYFNPLTTYFINFLYKIRD